MTSFTESVVEQAALAWLEPIGWRVAHGPDIAPNILAAERRDYGEVVPSLHVRHMLLPKLISGELRGRDAEELITENI